VLLLLDFIFCLLSLSPALSLLERASSVILSRCITYRAIECPDHDPGTRALIRSGRSIILSPCIAPSLGDLIGRLGKKSTKSFHERRSIKKRERGREGGERGERERERERERETGKREKTKACALSINLQYDFHKILLRFDILVKQGWLVNEIFS